METANTFIKPLVLILFVATSLFVASCEEDQPTVNIDLTEKLIGTWEYEKYGTENELFNYIDEGCGLPKITFNENGTGQTELPLFGQTPGECVDFGYDFTWTIDGNIVTIESESAGTEQAEILEINNLKLKIKITTITESGTYIDIYVLKRIF